MTNSDLHHSAAPSTGSAFDLAALAQSFAENGYVVLPGAVSKPGLQRFAQALAEEFAAWQVSNQSFRGGGLLSGHLNCYPGELARGVFNELRSSGVIDVAQALFPTEPTAARVGCNFNLPGSVEQHYHMDGTFLESYLIVNVVTVDTTLENGAIELIPKTHKRFYKYWEFATGRVWQGAIRVPARQGDVLIRLSTLWHRGMPNHSKTPRPMLAITMGEKGVHAADPLAKPQVEFQANWFTTSLAGRLRERVTVTAPIIYSGYRFARSLIGNKGYAAF